MTRLSRSALIVSDSAPLRRYVASILAAIDLVCAEASSGFHAMDLLSERQFDLYFLDLDMQRSDGLTIFAITLLSGYRDPLPIVIGCSAGEPSSAWSDPSKLVAILPKPFHPDELIAAAKAALKIGGSSASSP
jgi:CheY-like chemotaxis protein